MMNNMDNIISMQSVIDLHKIGIEKYGGDLSAPASDCVERSIKGSYTSSLYEAGEESVPNPLIVACFLLRNFVENHCFTDGNKRVGWSVFIDYLRRNGVGIIASQEEAAEFVLSIISEKLSVADIADWSAERLGSPA